MLFILSMQKGFQLEICSQKRAKSNCHLFLILFTALYSSLSCPRVSLIVVDDDFGVVDLGSRHRANVISNITSMDGWVIQCDGFVLTGTCMTRGFFDSCCRMPVFDFVWVSVLLRDLSNPKAPYTFNNVLHVPLCLKDLCASETWKYQKRIF